MIIGKIMCGRSVVESMRLGAIDHSLYYCLITDYTTSVVVWSKFLEKLNFYGFQVLATCHPSEMIVVTILTFQYKGHHLENWQILDAIKTDQCHQFWSVSVIP